MFCRYARERGLAASVLLHAGTIAADVAAHSLSPALLTSLLGRAAAWLELGKREEAFAVLRAGNSNVTGADVLLWWPVFDAVREEPEFKTLISAMGFSEAHARAQAWRQAHPPEKVEAKK